MKKIILMFVVAVMAAMSALAQTNMVGRTYSNANILAGEFDKMVAEVDQKLDSVRIAAYAKAKQKKGRELTAEEKAEVEKQVKALGVAKTQGQLDALVSFAFNLGIGNLKRSTLLKCIKEQRSMREIKRQFMRWVYADNKILKGLQRRREWEAKRFFE